MVLILDQTTKLPTSTEILAFIFFPSLARHPEENVYPSQIHPQPAGLNETPNSFSVSPVAPLVPGLPGAGAERALETLSRLASGTALQGPGHISHSWERDAGSWVVAKLGCPSNLRRASGKRPITRALGFMVLLYRDERS